MVAVAEFNDRRGEFPIDDTGQDVVAARKQVLDRLIEHKLIAREARRRNVQARLRKLRNPRRYQEERLLVQSLIKKEIANPLLVSDAEAEKYFNEQRSTFQQLETTNPTDEDRLVFVKFTLLSERWRRRREQWRSQVDIEVAEELLK